MSGSAARSPVVEAAERIGDGVRRTPSVRSRTLSRSAGADVFLKLENRQTTGSYKERGALNAMLMLAPAERARGVVTMSAGNHGQAVAYHGARLGIATTVVMPETTPFLKVRRTRDFGATVVLAGANFDEAATHARALAAQSGATIVHPYDDENVIAGQGTAWLEMLEDVPGLDVLLAPIGGGGLVSGAVLAVAAAGTHATIVGVQAASHPAMAELLFGAAAGSGAPTIAEGIAVKSPGTITRGYVARGVSDVVLVSEAAIETSIAGLLEDEKLVVEGAGAAGVAALLEHAGRFAGRRVGTILCGGNIDLGMLAAVVVRHRMRSGRVVRVRVHMVDAPGELASVALAISGLRANVLDIAHHRVFGSLSAKHAELDLTVEVERPDDLEGLMAAIAARGFEAEVVTE